MAADCCDSKSTELEVLSRRSDQRRVLIAVLVVNAVMFVGELAVGLYAGSSALVADSADMFGDAFVYALSLYALDRSERWKAGAALVKGVFILFFGATVLLEVGFRIASGAPPLSTPMLVMSVLALAANLYCFRLLWRFRKQDLNMSSTFECSQNDIAANVGVVLAAIAVWYFHSPWPDIVMGAIIAVIFLRSAVRVIRAAWPAWRQAS